MKRLRVSEALHHGPRSDLVTVKGWVRTKRESKAGFSFLELNDGSCMKNLQILVEGTLPNYESELRHVTTGCSVEVEGRIVESPGKGQLVELKANAVRVIGWADPVDYPLQKKNHSFEFLRQIAHLRSRTNTFGAICRVRHVLSMAIHEFFHERGFLYIHTPLITASDCEGAGQLFRVTTLDPENPPKREGHVDFEHDFFGTPTYLTVSGQLEAEALACSLGDVYTFGPTFRAENSNTSRHLSEFWMAEPEMAFCDLERDMEVAEAFLKFLLGTLLAQCAGDMEFFDQRIHAGLIENLEKITKSPFERLSYGNAISLLEDSGESFIFPAEWGIDLQTEHERYLTERIYNGPVIIHDYPATIKPFYMYLNDDGRTVRAMDVLVPQTGEIIGGSQREDRYEVLLKRIKDTGLDPRNYGWYLDLRRFGSVPHAGFGLGFERLVQFVTGMHNIRDVIPFPRTPKSAEF